jgi:hypothetical protein
MMMDIEIASRQKDNFKKAHDDYNPSLIAFQYLIYVYS